jgi:hypothetical protein
MDMDEAKESGCFLYEAAAADGRQKATGLSPVQLVDPSWLVLLLSLEATKV